MALNNIRLEVMQFLEKSVDSFVAIFFQQELKIGQQNCQRFFLKTALLLVGYYLFNQLAGFVGVAF